MARRKKESPRVSVTIRISRELAMQIDEALELRQIPISRNNWLLEAALKKLERTNTRGANGTE